MELSDTPAMVPAQPLRNVVEAKMAAKALKRMTNSTFYHLGRKRGDRPNTRQAVEALQL
jgi:hypothetical protein